MASLPLTELPIHAVLPALHGALRRNACVVLQAAPGAGKSSVVPLSLLEAEWLQGRQIWMLEPRRLAAQAAARQLARNMGDRQVGERVGLITRDQQKLSADTQIVVLTEGVLTQKLQQDPELHGVAAVIFDEFHERSLQADFGLALSREVQAGLRADLRLLLMSATLDGQGLAAELSAEWVDCPGRQFPLEIMHRPMSLEEACGTGLRRLVDEIAAQEGGSVLVFLPGEVEIRRAAAALRAGHLPVYSLFARLKPEEQEKAIFGPERRIILATAVAETSLTVTGVDTVIDAGWSRFAEFDPVAGHSRLVTRRVTEAQAGQRAGRAGRTGPGQAWRLWSSEETLRAELAPEIRRVDLGRLALELGRWGSDDLPWLEPPHPPHLAQARDTLRTLRLMDARGALTFRGQAAARLPSGEREALLLLAAAGANEPLRSALLQVAVLLSGQVRLPREPLDIEALLHDLEAGRLDASLTQSVRREIRRLQGRLAMVPKAARLSVGSLSEALLVAFPDRLAQRRGGRGRFRLSGGGGARLFEDSTLAGADWLIVLDVDGSRAHSRPGAGESGREGQIRRALPLSEEQVLQLCADRIEERTEQRLDETAGRVIATRERCLGALILHSHPCALTDVNAATQTLVAGIAGPLWGRLPWTPVLRQVCARAGWLHEQGAIAADMSDGALRRSLDDWLLPFLAGLTDIREIDARTLSQALDYRLGAERVLMERLAPAQVVINGRRFTLDYAVENAPVLAAEVQWLYGLSAGPAVMDGRHAVCLHLLNPARRPLAVTRDLASFWANAWPEVRGQMRSRYPRHAWPERPQDADLPERFVRLRSSSS